MPCSNVYLELMSKALLIIDAICGIGAAIMEALVSQSASDQHLVVTQQITKGRAAIEERWQPASEESGVSMQCS